MRSNRALIKALFGPAEDRGEWSLPPELVDLRHTVQRLENGLQTVPEPADIGDVQAAALAAARAAENPATLDVTALLDHDRAVAEYDHRQDTLRTALEHANEDLNAHITEHRDQIITEALQPALTKLWGEVTSAAKILHGLNVENRDDLLTATDKQRRSYLQLDDLAARYGRLREAWSRVRQGVEPQHDARVADHAEFEAGLCTIWPEKIQFRMMDSDHTPWPTEPRDRLLWIARQNHTPWLPTVAEQDAAWMTAHRDEHEAVQEQGRRGRMVRQWGRSVA